MKIEKKGVGRSRNGSPEFLEFVEALEKLRPGESFLVEKITAYKRFAIHFAQFFLHRSFVTRREGDKRRIGRTQ